MNWNLKLFVFLIGSLFFVACGNENTGEDATVSEAGEVAQASQESVMYTIDTDNSVIHWEGYKPSATHNGIIKVKSGEIAMKGDMPESGSILIDMTTIEDQDLEGEYKTSLENHLMGLEEGREDDFFNVTQYPTSTFEITKVEAMENDSTANAMVSGNLTLRDTTQMITFKANIKQTDNMLKVTTPKFTIDRTQWGIMFMSRSIVDDIKNGIVEDEIGLILEIVAQKSEE